MNLYEKATGLSSFVVLVSRMRLISGIFLWFTLLLGVRKFFKLGFFSSSIQNFFNVFQVLQLKEVNFILFFWEYLVDCIDCAAEASVVSAVNEGIEVARAIVPVRRPWVMISVNDDEDLHFRKAGMFSAILQVFQLFDYFIPCIICDSMLRINLPHQVPTQAEITSVVQNCNRKEKHMM